MPAAAKPSPQIAHFIRSPFLGSMVSRPFFYLSVHSSANGIASDSAMQTHKIRTGRKIPNVAYLFLRKFPFLIVAARSLPRSASVSAYAPRP